MKIEGDKVIYERCKWINESGFFSMLKRKGGPGIRLGTCSGQST